MFGREEKVSPFRLTAVQYVLLAIFLFLAFGLWRLQVARSDYYSSLAEQNRIKQVPILAPRGKLLDREGRIIVDNYPSFSVLLLRDQNRNLEVDAEKIAEGLHIPPDELRARLKRMAAVPGYQPLFLKDDITPDELAFIESHRADLPELDIITVHRRLYPKDGFMAHVIGYVGQVSEEMLTQPQWELYNPGDVVGMSGVEQYYNDILMGKNGSRQVLVNSRGKEVGTLSDVPAVPGKQLKLTIDLDLQIAAEQALEGKPGAIVAMDPRTGEILAMVSRPAFDPNAFAVRVTRDEWNRLMTDPGKPLLNKAIQAQLGAGFGVQDHHGDGRPAGRHRAGPGGELRRRQDFLRALFQVLDCGRRTALTAAWASPRRSTSPATRTSTRWRRNWASAASRSTPPCWVWDRRRVSICRRKSSGVMPSEEWKIKNFKQKWYAGETISVGIGQGAVATTPIQLARAIGAITTDGSLRRPHIAFPEQFPPEFKQVSKYNDETKIPIDEKNWVTITDAMAQVVSPGGTAASARSAGHRHRRKDGQRADGFQRTEEEDVGQREEHVTRTMGGSLASLRGVIPRLVVACLFEGGEHGALAARVASKVIKAYVEKQRNRQTQVAKSNACSCKSG